MAHEIWAARCTACQSLSYPTHFYCPSCGATAFEPVAIAGEGTLVTWTRAYALSLDYEQRYLTFGIVKLDMGISALGQLAVAEPRTGMRVRADVGKVRETEGSDIHGLVFRAP